MYVLWKNCLKLCFTTTNCIFSYNCINSVRFKEDLNIIQNAVLITQFIFPLVYVCKYITHEIVHDKGTLCFLLKSVVFLFSSSEKGSGYLGGNVAWIKTFSATLFRLCFCSIVSFIFCIFITILPSQLYSLVWYVILFFCLSHKCQIWAKICV